MLPCRYQIPLKVNVMATFSLATHPLIQAPMAGVSTPELAAAVSNAGALGSIGLGAATPQKAREMIQATRALTDRPFNVNLFCHAAARRDAGREQRWINALTPEFSRFNALPPSELREIYQSFIDNPEMLAVLLEAPPAVVSFHFGLPDQRTLEALRQAGVHTLACATSVEEAVQIAEAGIDTVIAQGAEAGGHRGMFDPDAPDALTDTLSLVKAIRQRCQLPVIAAGGIMDGADIARALEAGACAAQLGTAFVPCPESSADAHYREALNSERAQHTALTRTISGRPARGIINRLHIDASANDVADYPVAYDIGKALHQAASAKGCHDYAAHWAGTGAPRSRAMPATQLVETLMQELEQKRQH
jgi:nitronate monooxygenase